MPQLDQFTYCTQIVWLCISFMGYYVLVYNYGLPKISRLLKLRARLLSQQNGGLSAETGSVSQESILVNGIVGSEQSISESSLLSECAHYLNNSVAGASQWCNNMVVELNANQLNSANKTYVQNLAEINLSNYSKSKALSNLTALTSDSLRLTESFKISNKQSNWKVSTVSGITLLNALLILRLRKHSLSLNKKQESIKQKANARQSKTVISKKLNKKNA